jgi:hypothetical protein
MGRGRDAIGEGSQGSPPESGVRFIFSFLRGTGLNLFLSGFLSPFSLPEIFHSFLFGLGEKRFSRWI